MLTYLNVHIQQGLPRVYQLLGQALASDITHHKPTVPMFCVLCVRKQSSGMDKGIQVTSRRIWLCNRHEEQSETDKERERDITPLLLHHLLHCVKPERIRDDQRDRQHTQKNKHKHQHRQSTENTDTLKQGKNVGGGKTSICGSERIHKK